MDIFSTDYLLGVVESLIRPPSFALDMFFTAVTQDESEEIHFDVIDKKRRLAPFVSPLVPGKVMDSVGRKVSSFQPAYTKDKRRFDATRPFKRAVGEQIGGTLTPQQRMEQAIVADLQDQVEILDRRMEVMAMEALRTGKVTVVGDEYPSVTVDFGRDASLSPAALAGTAKWTDTTSGVSHPLQNLRDWALAVLQKSGAWPRKVIMEVTAFDAFIDHPDVADRWKAANTNVNGTLQLGAAIDQEGGIYMGSMEGFDFYVYAGWYLDDSGTEQPIVPAGNVILASSLVQGVRAYGAIKDHDVLRAVPYFPKSWLENDPSVRWLMLQSAPLVVPTRPNATYSRKVT